jgi:hypothetical protein
MPTETNQNRRRERVYDNRIFSLIANARRANAKTSHVRAALLEEINTRSRLRPHCVFSLQHAAVTCMDLQRELSDIFIGSPSRYAEGWTTHAMQSRATDQRVQIGYERRPTCTLSVSQAHIYIHFARS